MAQSTASVNAQMAMDAANVLDATVPPNNSNQMNLPNNDNPANPANIQHNNNVNHSPTHAHTLTQSNAYITAQSNHITDTML